MATENDYNECVSFYCDDNPAKNCGLKRKADQDVDEKEISSDKSRKILRFEQNVTQIDIGESRSVSEIKEHTSDEDSFAVVPKSFVANGTIYELYWIYSRN